MRGKKGGEMLSEGLAPWSLSCLRMFTGAISGRSLWQGNLVSFYLTSLFDACCEGGGFEKILLLSTARALFSMRGATSVPLRALCYNARYRLGTARALHYNARYRLGTARALYYNARYRLGTRLGTARALHYNARYRLGTARALCYSARYRPGTASVPLGPSITMRGTDTPCGFYKVLIGSE